MRCDVTLELMADEPENTRCHHQQTVANGRQEHEHDDASDSKTDLIEECHEV